MRRISFIAIFAIALLFAGGFYIMKRSSTFQSVSTQYNVSATPFISLAKDAALGDYLIGKRGMALYVFNKDEPRQSNCKDQCANNWPPLEPEGPLTAASGISGTLGVITRDNGVSQVTFGGKPLYYWVNDKKPGDVTGQGVNGVWFLAQP